MPNFYAQKDANGYPIPGTMMSTNGTVPNVGNIVAIGAQDVSSSVDHPKNLIYTVGKDSSGNIIPNTLRTYFKKPEKDVYEHKKS